MKNTLVISAFPCSGKTDFFVNQTKYEVVLDSDSSNFSWINEVHPYHFNKEIIAKPQKVRNPDFPYNYIQHIKNNIGKADIIFISSHKDVREAMQKESIEYYLVYPAYEMRNEFIGRAYSRGSSPSFITTLYQNWDDWYNYTANSISEQKETVFWINRYHLYMSDMIPLIEWSRKKNEEEN